jgi:hypothetical protein
VRRRGTERESPPLGREKKKGGGRGALAEAKTGSKPRTRGRGVPYEKKRKAVRLHLEEGIPAKGPASRKEPGTPGVRAAIREQIVEIKRRNQKFGIKRIAQVLRRMFHLPSSPETARKTLHQAELIEPVRRKPHRNPSKPRFFERTTPNQYRSYPLRSPPKKMGIALPEHL